MRAPFAAIPWQSRWGKWEIWGFPSARGPVGLGWLWDRGVVALPDSDGAGRNHGLRFAGIPGRRWNWESGYICYVDGPPAEGVLRLQPTLTACGSLRHAGDVYVYMCN